jgi:hypothetical protein
LPLSPESGSGVQPADINRLIAAVKDATLASGRSSSALLGLTRVLVWLTVVVASSAVVSLAVALIR